MDSLSSKVKLSMYRLDNCWLDSSLCKCVIENMPFFLFLKPNSLDLCKVRQSLIILWVYLFCLIILLRLSHIKILYQKDLHHIKSQLRYNVIGIYIINVYCYLKKDQNVIHH